MGHPEVHISPVWHSEGKDHNGQRTLKNTSQSEEDAGDMDLVTRSSDRDDKHPHDISKPSNQVWPGTSAADIELQGPNPKVPVEAGEELRPVCRPHMLPQHFNGL